MPTFEQIKTEYSAGKIGGVDYGSKVRILMRSADYVLFVGYGMNLMKRGRKGWPESLAKNSKKETAQSETVRNAVIKAFGPEADEWLIKAITTKGKGTILVDGGGEKMRLPDHEARLIAQARYESLTASKSVKLDDLDKCIECGNDIPIVTEIIYMEHGAPKEGAPRTIEDCQRMSNQRVIEVKGHSSNTPQEWWGYVSFYRTWDGQSYIDNHFCSDKCAAAYGRRAAKTYEILPIIKEKE